MNRSLPFRVLLPLIFLLPCSTVLAEPIDEEQARYAAAEFFSPSSQSTRLRAKGRQLVLRSQGHERGYYIFDRPEGGAVFVADDDAIGRTVLGYTDQGSFDADNCPLGLQDWLEQMAVLMDAVHEGKINRTEVRQGAGKTVVPALIQTSWDQIWPYNNLCPTVDGVKCLTGCVATAMAQVMKYWEWPEHGYGSVKYDDPGCGQTLSTNLSAHTYDWKNMRLSYATSGYEYPESQITSVATLLRDCGYAVQTYYTPGASGSFVIADHMQQYFHYSASARTRRAQNYSEEIWHQLIRQDLLEGRPVLYSGYDEEDYGHEFIIDGYNSEDYYHINWGWSGYMDGNYMLTDLNGYNQDQWMISHLMPDYSEDTPFSYTLSGGVLTIRGTGMMPEEYQLQTAPWLEESNNIRKIVIGEGITSIPDYFGYAASSNSDVRRFYNLEEVSLPEGLVSIGSYAFLGTSKLSAVQLPSTLVYMNYAFFNCDNIKSLRLPKALEEFADYLPGLEALSVDADNPLLSAASNILYDKDGKLLLFVPQNLDRIIVAETTEQILEPDFLYNGIPILSKCMNAPVMPKLTASNIGYLYLPYRATGYESWKAMLPSGWRVSIFNPERIPEVGIDWTLEGGTLTLSGWGKQKDETFSGRNAPYYTKRNQVQKLVVGEDIHSLCQKAFMDYSNLREAELPSNISYLDEQCFAYTGIKTITCYSKLMPSLGRNVFYGMPGNGTLRIPKGANYSAWLRELPGGWKIEYFTPEPLVACRLYTGKTSDVNELSEWDELLTSFPNAVGIINPRHKEWAYLVDNLLIEDQTATGGYRCPSFRLTDLSYGFAQVEQAPSTGFTAPVSFTVTKGEYRRKLTDGYNSVCLPFAIREEELPRNCRMYAYSYYDSDLGNVVFVPMTTTEAGHPCFIKCSSDYEWLTDLTGVTITTQLPSADDTHMRGTFISTDTYQGIGYSPRAKDNIFAPLESYLHPFRACVFIRTTDNSQQTTDFYPSEVPVVVCDEPDGMSTIDNAISMQSSAIVNLAGQRLSKLSKGINVVNGKKIIK